MTRNKSNTPGRLIYLPFRITTTSREYVARFRPNLGTLETCDDRAETTLLREWSLASSPSEQALVWFINTHVNETTELKTRSIVLFEVDRDRAGERQCKLKTLDSLGPVFISRPYRKCWLTGSWKIEKCCTDHPPWDRQEGLPSTEMLSGNHFQIKKKSTITTPIPISRRCRCNLTANG